MRVELPSGRIVNIDAIAVIRMMDNDVRGEAQCRVHFIGGRASALITGDDAPALYNAVKSLCAIPPITRKEDPDV